MMKLVEEKNEIHCVNKKNKTNFERTERASAARRSEQITEVETRFYFFHSRLLIVTLRSQRRSLFFEKKSFGSNQAKMKSTTFSTVVVSNICRVTNKKKGGFLD